MEETLSQLSQSVESVQRKFWGVTVGRVINLLDPLTLGRVQVQLPMIDDVELSPWARVAVPMAGLTHGHYFIPNFGDQVLIAFENGELQAPYVIGSLWNATAPPPLPSPVPQIRVLRTLAGNQLVFTEVPPTVTLQSGPTPPVTIPAPPTPAGPPTVILAPTGIQIIFGLNVINMTPDGITITGNPNLNLVASASITMTAPKVTITGATSTDVLSGGTVAVAAPMVRIN